MNKKILITGLVLSIFMLMLQGSAVLAVSPIIEVEGNIDSGLAGPPVTAKNVGGNNFMLMQTVSTWDGVKMGLQKALKLG